MKILVVDDERIFARLTSEGHFVIYARDAEYGLDMLLHSEWDEVWLDHDLGYTEYDGTWLANKIEVQAYIYGDLLNVGAFVIHTGNPVARMRMAETLRKFYNVRFVRAEDYL